jgi:hypothetical protein
LQVQGGYKGDGSAVFNGTTSASGRKTRIPPSRFTSYTFIVITGMSPVAGSE